MTPEQRAQNQKMDDMLLSDGEEEEKRPDTHAEHFKTQKLRGTQIQMISEDEIAEA